MITIEGGRRRRCNGERFEFPTRNVSTSRALESLVLHELGFGGQVTEINATRLAISTPIMSYDDYTVFYGEAEEMRPLIEIAAVYLMACADGRTMDNVARYLTEEAPIGIRGQALFLTRFGFMVLGTHRMQIALIAFCQVTDEAVIDAALRLSLRELLVITQFVIDGDCTFSEGLEISQTDNVSTAA